jgi:hypothetical protein
MTQKLNRRDFVVAGTSLGVLASTRRGTANPSTRRKTRCGFFKQWKSFEGCQNLPDLCRDGIQDDHGRQGCTGCGNRWGQHRRTGPRGHERRICRPSQRRWSGSTRCFRNARSAETCERRRILEGVRTPSLVAKKVMDETDHVLLVGKDAQRFAREMDFTIEDDLNTPRSRQQWQWKRRTDLEHILIRSSGRELGIKVGLEMVAEGKIDPDHYWGTINCNGVNSKGEVCGVTTTSGLAWKIPGRVGDSPIIAAGLYVDGEIGAAGSTGRGEANLISLASFVIVESMRQGMSPKDAGMTALKRIKSQTIEKRLLNDRGEPNFWRSTSIS